MASEYESMVIYKSFYEAVAECDPETFKKVFVAVFEYGMRGIQPELDGVAKALFSLMKPQIDANIRKRENGIKGGRPKNLTITKQKPNNNLTETKGKPNVNVNVNVNDNANDNDDYLMRHESPSEKHFNQTVKLGLAKKNPHDPLTEEEKARIQNRVDEFLRKRG